ncbi:uncharacterized protein METZ01_LOCUS458880, partial [marine metagenome]
MSEMSIHSSRLNIAVAVLSSNDRRLSAGLTVASA